MSRRSLAALLLVACLVALLLARNSTHADRASQGPEDREETVDFSPPDPVLDPAREEAASPSAFASFKIDGMI